MNQSLWDLKQINKIATKDKTPYHEPIPMGFETGLGDLHLEPLHLRS